MADKASNARGTLRDGARSGERRRLYCQRMRGREAWVGDGLVRFDDLGFVVGVIKGTKGPVDPPRALADDQVRTLAQVAGLVELSPSESRRVPLEAENRRRREAFVERVTEAVRSARRTHRRWPSVREVQAVLVRTGHPRGRKEKIAALIEGLKQAQVNGTRER